MLFSTLDKKKADEFIKKYGRLDDGVELHLKESELDSEIHMELLSCYNPEGSKSEIKR